MEEKKIAERVLLSTLKKAGFKYQDFGHHSGATIWWVDNKGKVQTHVSTGSEMHHELNKRLDMDLRWRGRMDNGSVTMIPPVREYSRIKDIEDISMPSWLIRQLEKMGGKTFYVDTPMDGMLRVAFKK
jgi:hypothetical protein